MTRTRQIDILQQMRRWLAWVTFMLVAAFAAMFGPSLWRAAMLDRTPPIVAFTKSEALNSPVTAGDQLAVRVWRDKVRDDCPGSARRHIVSEDGVITHLPASTFIGGAPSAAYVDLGYQIPDSVPPGFYDLHVALEYVCPGGLVFAYSQPPARFRVIGPGEPEAPVAEQLDALRRQVEQLGALRRQIERLNQEIGERP